MKQDLTTSVALALVMTVVALGVQQLSFAAVATSTNYQLQSDSINFGGGLSTSTSYRQESTFGEIATGEATSTSYKLKAGYQQMQEVYISMTSPGDVTLLPALGGITGGTSNGSTTVTVVTDSPAGYSLSIQAQNNPAMQSGSNSIPDHVTVITRDFQIPGGSASFGYSIYGVNAVGDFYNDGSGFCGSGVNASLVCWRGLETTPYQVAQGNGSNHPSGANTTINFRVGVSAGAGVIAGVYTATTTLTALPL